ncbi:MAG: DUF5689 domain-containing protein [Rikenellaceae bacterium]
MYRCFNSNVNYYSTGGVGFRCLLLLLCVVANCACINRFDASSTEGELLDVAYDITIQRLHSYLPSSGYYDVKSDLVIQGNVTATDEGGNFYKSFVIEQGGYGVEVLEGMTYSYVRHEEGCLISLQLNGLRLSRSRGVLQVGVAASEGSYYDLDYMEHDYVVDAHILNTGRRSEIVPRAVTPAELADEGFVAEFAGSLVSVGGLSLLLDDDASGATLWGGTLEFVDDQGRTVECYTSDYADFSMCEVPEARVALCGILQCDYNDGASSPMIKLRRERDCTIEL